MSWVDGVRYRLRALLRPRAVEVELKEEMQHHQELAARDAADPQVARRRFGNATWYMEETRRMTWPGLLDTIRQDVSYAVRSVSRAPIFTLVIVSTLALGIGVNASLFSLLDHLYLRPPGGVTAPETLRRVWLQRLSPADGAVRAVQNLNYPVTRVLAATLHKQDALAVYTAATEVRLGREAAAPTRVVYASANLFSVLGTQPASGRFYTAEEDRWGAGAHVVVVSDAFRQRHFATDTAVVGAGLRLGAREYTIIGVAQPGFTGLDMQPTDLWVPLAAMHVPGFHTTSWWESVNTSHLRAVMRVAAQTPIGLWENHATRSVRDFHRQTNSQQPDTLLQVVAGSIIEARGPGTPAQHVQISIRLGAVSLIVLLIACANVTNLLLARAVQRRREQAVRVALGISRGRLIRLACAETLLLAAIAGAAAMLAAFWGGAALRRLLLPDIEWTAPALDLRVGVFTMGAALLVGLLTGVALAIRVIRISVTGSLAAGAHTAERRRSIVRTGLVMAQTALCVMLLIGAALFVRSLRTVLSLDIGFDASQVLLATLLFDDGDHPPPARLSDAMLEVERRLQPLPAVEAVARASTSPMMGFSYANFYIGSDSVLSFGRDAPSLTAVSPSYFSAVGLRLVRGRAFGTNNGTEAVVNEAMATLAWRGQEPIGQCIYFDRDRTRCYRVTGIVANARRSRVIEEDAAAQYYVPLDSSPIPLHGTSILVRAAPGMAAVAAAHLRNELEVHLPRAVVRTMTMLDYLEPQYRPWRLGAMLFVLLGLLALLVALIGIYTAVSYGVAQRTHEFGVRVALGARQNDLVRLVVGEGLRTVAVGIAVGVVLALAAGRLIASLLYGVAPHDPLALTAVSISLLVVATLAALLPARRAARVTTAAPLRSG